MRLNDDKISDIAFNLTDRLEQDSRVEFIAPKNSVRARVSRSITSELQMEDDVIRIVTEMIDAMKSVKRDSKQWDAHFERLYKQEMAKRGRDWDINARDVHR
ncbi:DUF507 family protein [bacterium]|nr:DUF507 family protein [bacterium]